MRTMTCSMALVPATGTRYHGGGASGDQRRSALPEVERLNNPNISST